MAATIVLTFQVENALLILFVISTLQSITLNAQIQECDPVPEAKYRMGSQNAYHRDSLRSGNPLNRSIIKIKFYIISNQNFEL